MLFEALFTVVALLVGVFAWLQGPQKDVAPSQIPSKEDAKVKTDAAEAKRKAEAEAKRKQAEAAKAEAKKKAEAEAEAKRKAKAEAEAEAKRKAEAQKEEAARLAAEEAAKSKAAEEEAAAKRKAAEAEAARKAAEEAKAAEEEAKKKAAEEEARKKAAEEEAKKKAAEEEAAAEAERIAKEKEEEEERRAIQEARAAALAREKAAEAAAAAEIQARKEAEEEARLAAAAKARVSPPYDKTTLSRCLFSLQQRVEANCSKHGVPPRDKLIAYIEASIAPPILDLSANGPDEVKSTIKRALAYCRYTPGEGIPEDADVDLDDLRKTLSELVSQFPRVVASKPAPTTEEEVVHLRLKPNQEELSDIRAACAYLWELDVGRLEQGDDYVIDLQRGKKPYSDTDISHDPLFTFVDDEVFNRPTYKTFRALLDNYAPQTGKAEQVTHAEKREEDAFLAAILNTPVMRYTYEYVKAKGLIRDKRAFEAKLEDMWFNLYRRDARNDSCGFEHVFVGEIDDGVVKGMHNWIQLYIQEKMGRFNYQGFIFPRGRRCDYNDPFENDHIMTIQFEWLDVIKPVSTSFVGVSPEFEVALYSLCLMCKKDSTHATLGGHDINVRVYKYGRAMIGTAFPEDQNS